MRLDCRTTESPPPRESQVSGLVVLSDERRCIERFFDTVYMMAISVQTALQKVSYSF